MANLATRAVELVAADLEARIRAGDATASAELRELVAQAMREAGPFIPTRGNGAPLLNQPIVRDFTPYNAGPAPSPFKPMVRDPMPGECPQVTCYQGGAHAPAGEVK